MTNAVKCLGIALIAASTAPALADPPPARSTATLGDLVKYTRPTDLDLHQLVLDDDLANVEFPTIIDPPRP